MAELVPYHLDLGREVVLLVEHLLLVQLGQVGELAEIAVDFSRRRPVLRVLRISQNYIICHFKNL